MYSTNRVQRKSNRKVIQHRKMNEEKLCRECSADCCRDLTMMITKPRTEDDIEELSWYLRIDSVSVFIRKYKWHLLFKGKCIYLTRNNMCRIYDKRPDRCRRHQPSECERTGPFYDTLITTPEELENHLDGGK